MAHAAKDIPPEVSAVATKYAHLVAIFALTETSGPNWDAQRRRREQHGWDEHAAFMDVLVDDGFVILGGPIGDGERVLLVVEATDDREIEARLGKDPWVSTGVLQIGEIERWTVWLDGRKPSGRADRDPVGG